MKITKKKLEEIVTKATKQILCEMGEYGEQNGKPLFHTTIYSSLDENDKSIINANIDKWWNFLQEAYADKGGFKTFQSAKDMKRKPLSYRVAYVNDEVVAIAVYNPYITGNKCVGVGSIQGDMHRYGVVGVKLLMREDAEQWKDFYWIEVDSKMEKICKDVGGFHMPYTYIVDLLPYPTSSIGDGFHYTRSICGIDFVKTVFGFPNKSVLNSIIANENDKLMDFIVNIENKMVDIDYSKLDEHIEMGGKRLSVIDGAKQIIYVFQDYLVNRGITEYTPELYNKFVYYLNLLKKLLDENRDYFDKKSVAIYEAAIEDGEDVLKNIGIIQIHTLAG